MAAPSLSFEYLVQKHQALILFVENELLSQENFHKLADHIAHQARFENRLVFPILCQPCSWENSSLKHITVYPLNKRPISEWESPDAGWRQVLQEINTVLNPYRSFYPETPLEKALRGVGRVQVEGKTANSGFLITPNLLLTASELTLAKAVRATVSFTRSGGLSAHFRLLPTQFLLTDPKTGITLVAVEIDSEQQQFREALMGSAFQTLILTNKSTQPDDRLLSATFDSLLHHPFAYQTVESADEESIRYRGPLVPGALGGPLLNESLEVAAVSPEGDNYELLAYSQQSQQVDHVSATVPTIQALLRKIASRTTAKDWLDATGNDVRSPLMREFPVQEPEVNQSPFSEIATNRTLLILSFTYEPPLKPEITFGLQSLEDIFNYFQPKVTVNFRGPNGETITETFHFRNLSDFSPDQFTKQSRFLSALANAVDFKADPSARLKYGLNREGRLYENQQKVADQLSELETTYRSAAPFFSNAQTDRIPNLSIVNASIDQLADQDNPRFYNEIAQELISEYDRLDLRNSYSLLVIPGFLRSRQALDPWAQLARTTKVMLLTDYRNLDNAEDILYIWEKDALSGADAYKANVVMTCNYLIGREPYTALGEEMPLFLPASVALAGKLYVQNLVAETGNVNLIATTAPRFNLTKQEVSYFEDHRLVLLTKSFKEIKTTSERTLYNGDNTALRFYPVVRLLDWVVKSLIDFMNRRAFVNWDYSTAQEQRKQIDEFLASMTGPEKIISSYRILRYEPDPNVRGIRHLAFQIMFRTLAQSFQVYLKGEEDDKNEIKWEDEIE